MKKITLFLTLMMCTFVFSQNLISNGDFENGNTGWTGNAVNVVTEGGNSYNAASIASAGNAYDVNISYVLPINTQGQAYKLTFDAFSDTNRILVAGIGLNQNPYTATVQTVNLTTTPQTFVLTLVANFSSPTSRVIFDMGSAVGFVGIDNVVLELTTTTCNNGVQDGNETGIDCGGSCSACVPSPLVAAPTPPNRPTADVKSIFSDAYAPISVIGYASGGSNDDNTYNTSWCPGSTTLIQVAGNNINKITGLGCEGIGFLAGRFDATGFTRFHIDIWTPTTTQDKVFSFKFSNWNGTGGETNAYEYTATNANVLTSGAEGTWISIDIPFSTPTFNCINTPPGNACPSVSDFAQFVITSNLGTVYYDNLYLHKNTLGTASFNLSSIKMYPNPANDVLNISSETIIDTVTIYNTLGQMVSNQKTSSNDVSVSINGLPNGVYILTAQIGNELVRKQFIKE